MGTLYDARCGASNRTVDAHRPGMQGLRTPLDNSRLRRWLFRIIAAVVLIYALLAGLRTVTDYDLFWQLASGRWIAQHHQIPATDVLSYTAQGQPWIYPAGSELLLYTAILLGGYTLLSWLGAAACVATIAIILRRGNLWTALLAVFAVPMIATRTAPRAEMFTVVLFAAFVALLWQQHELGRTKLWVLPILMVLWVNLHLGFVAGLAMIGGYGFAEVLQLLWASERKRALEQLQTSWPWLLATCAVTVVSPWGWGIYRALFRQEAAMAAHSQSIGEWTRMPLNWTAATASFSLRNPNGSFLLLLLLTACAVCFAMLQRRFGAAVLMVGAAWLGVRHVRLQALASIVMVVLGSAVFDLLLHNRSRAGDKQIRSIIAVALTCLVAALACIRSVDVTTNRTYLDTTKIGSFGTGLSWWFPEKAAAFVLQQDIPGQVFNDYNEGGFVTWRLGPKYLDYIDGRAIPFGPELLKHTNQLLASPPDSAIWQHESEKYDINTIIVALGRYDGLQFFPALAQFCSGDLWRPVYLDEVSAVFVRRRPETERLIQRSSVDCATAPLPANPHAGDDAEAFNQWANAAAVLRALGRNSEAFAATTKALNIFPDSAFIHFTRGVLLQQSGNFGEAGREYLVSAELQPSAVAPWATLGAYYQEIDELNLAAHAWQRAAELSPQPWGFLFQLGYVDLQLHQPRAALTAFDRAAASLPAQPTLVVDDSFLGGLARGRAMGWVALANFKQAISFQEQAVRWMPYSSRDWMTLAELYGRVGRIEDAERARQRAASLEQTPSLP